MRALIHLSLALLLFAATAAAQDSLAPARELYASAEYEEALTAFGRLKTEANGGAAAEIDRYRVLCLIALGRASEADLVIESIVINDPLYQPATADAAPRVRAAFGAVRQRILPGLVRTLYADAKSAFDRKAYPEAALGLERTVRVIDNIEGAGKADLNDLRTLASGFLELSRAAVPPPPPPVVTATAAPPGTAKPEAAPAPVMLPLYTNQVVIKQTIPPLPYALTSFGGGEFRGSIEVEIDDSGNVTNARMLQPVHAFYDPLLLKAARGWKYEPPRVGSKAIASRKRVEVVVRP